MSRDHHPLDPEERALADALARATPRDGPALELDAAILASARRALHAEPVGPGRHYRRRRWPVVVGVAASLALAVGVAWQLRPAPDAIVPAADEGPPVVFDAAMPAPREPEQADPAPGRELTPPMPAAARAVPPGQKGAPEPAEAPAAADAPAVAPGPPASPAPPAASTAAAPIPAAQPESGQPAFEPSPPPTDTAIGRKRIRQEGTGQAAATDARRATTGDIVFEHEGLDDEPPATVDSPQTRRAWLDRIRELRDAGELDAARESLDEYRRRYPDLDLPEDLEGLLAG